VALPFCFHLPNGLFLRVSLAGLPAMVVALQKVWTAVATGSSTADYYATDRVTYHNPTNLQTPNFPQDPVMGPTAQCSGVNIERERDSTGTYRYTRVQIFFDTTYSSTIKENNEEFARAEKEVVMIALQVVNRLIDVYRLVTRSDYVQRVPAIHVTDLFLRQHNLGSHGASFGHGIRTAIMNRSEGEVQEIAKCSGLQTVRRGLANSSTSRPTIIANTKASGLTIIAYGPTIIANGLQTAHQPHRHCK